MAENARTMFNSLKYPVILYSILAGLYCAYLPGKFVWFSYHPLAMISSFVLLAANATMLKRIGGLDNTRLHGQMMFLCVLISLFGWYVIYSNKEMMGKAHLMTYHGKLGAFVLISYVGIAMFGGVMLHPDYGMAKSNKQFRWLHKMIGRLLTATAWICSVLGFMTMQKQLLHQILFGFPLLLLGLFTLV